MHAVETLLPVVLLIILGWLLARFRFLGEGFMADLNKLTFYVALPAFIIRSMTEVQVPAGPAFRLFLILLVCTVIAVLMAPALAWLLGARRASLGSVAQAAFRGNLAYGGLPILTYSLIGEVPETKLMVLGLGLLVFAPLTASYNLLAVLCLQPGGSWRDLAGWGRTLRSIATNPLLISCLVGFGLALMNFRFPAPLHQALTALGGVALPVALLCIGGAFTHIRFEGRYRSIWVAVGVKLLVLPLLAWLGCEWFGVEGFERRIVLLFAAVPTAATAYTMAKEMGGDEIVTSAAIALSTVLAFITLTLVLWAA
jgi:predicted permease